MATSKISILDKLTFKYILDRVPQEVIFEKYIGIKVTNETLMANSCLSPFRKDNKPTCNYYYSFDSNNNPKLRFRDWNGSFRGDCFDAASEILKIKTDTPQSTALLLNKIAFDFKIHKYTDSEEVEQFDNFYTNFIKSKEILIYKVEPRPMNNYDKKYWGDLYGITKEWLKYGATYMVNKLYRYSESKGYVEVYRYRSSDPAYAYYGGTLNGIVLWKIYFPYRKNNRFISNYGFIYGYQFFQPARVGLITKSYKDVICYATYGISSISVPSETYVMKPHEIFQLKTKVDLLLTNFDYDPAGIRLAQIYKKKYNIFPLMFTKGLFNQPNFGAKDFTDFRAINGHENTQKLISSVITKNSETLDYFRTCEYETFKNILNI